MKKKVMREKRARRTRFKIRELGVYRLTIHKTPRHMYAQIISSDGAKTLAHASTLEKDIRNELKTTGDIKAATLIGKVIAKRAKEAGIEEVAFDRAGFLYHGRVKALADAAREEGLNF